MLGFPEYHHDWYIKYTKLFGSLFTDLEVYRENNKVGGVPSLQKVPVTEAQRDKVLAFANEEYGSAAASVSMVSPRIGFECVSFGFDPSRKTNKYTKIKLEDGTVRNYIPYNFYFQVYVVGKTVTDVSRVAEQIMPFFDPAMSVTIFPFQGDSSYSRDINISLNQITQDDNYQGAAENSRIVIWTLAFTMQAFVFGPVSGGPGSLIKKVTLSYQDMENLTGNTTYVEYSDVFPGLTANNTPTTDPTIAVDYKTVNADDPFAVITVFRD